MMRALIGSLVVVAEAQLNLKYYAPSDSATHPVIMFVTGGGGVTPPSIYSDLLGQLADKGYIVVGLDKMRWPNYPVAGQEFQDAMEWVKAGNLSLDLVKNNIKAIPDIEKVAVMGQSAGNHVVGQGLKDGCSIAKAFVMLDPVDGFDPFGLVHGEDLITPGQKLPFTIPSLLLDNELDPKKKNALFPACAPAKLGAPRWFDATAGPVWNVNASKYGHIDCTNDIAITAAGFVCPSDKSTDKAAYRSHLASAIDLFLTGLFDAKPEHFDALEDPTTFGVDVTLRHELNGLARTDVKAGCVNAPALV